MNKASRGDGIPVELFQILKDDAVEVLHSIWQQIWKTQQYNQDEETEEYPAGKGTGEMPTKPNKRGRDREST